MRYIFHRQLAAYAQYHRDPHNCATHFVGIPMLFLAVILPLDALRIPIDHHQVPLAMILTLRGRSPCRMRGLSPRIELLTRHDIPTTPRYDGRTQTGCSNGGERVVARDCAFGGD
jgi:Protein of unknown function (DUF962)